MGVKNSHISPEAREKLSRLAKERHAAGKLGGARFGRMGARKRSQNTANQRVAEAAREERNAKALIQVFKDAVAPDQPMGLRIKAAEAWLGVDREAAKLALNQAQQEGEAKSRDDLIAILAKGLTTGPAAEIMRKRLEEQNIPEAEVLD